MSLKSNKGLRIASLSFLANSAKLLAAPITLLIISNKLSSEELAFYYTFFSVVSLQQLAELGIGHTMKQFISHSYDVKNGEWSEASIRSINGYHRLTRYWFIGVSIFILSVVGICGYSYFSFSSSNVDWKTPWMLLVCVSALGTHLSPMRILLESTQRQEIVQTANLFSGLAASITLWIGITNGLGLLTIATSSFVSLLVLYLLLLRSYGIIKSILNINEQLYPISFVFKKVFPLLSKVSLVWFCSYFFWNSFNLLTFQIYEPSHSGKIIFSIALAMSGFQIATSITQSQMTMYSSYISKNNTKEAIELFKRYRLISFMLLISGYSFFLLIWEIVPDFYLFSKLPQKNEVIQLFIYFIFLFYQTVSNNFVRCFKTEPFVKQYIFLALSIGGVYYFANIFYPGTGFIGTTFTLTLVIIYNQLTIYKKYIGQQ